MQEERKQELIGLLKNAQRNADGSVVYIQGSDARDILAMLRADELPWKVYHHFDLVASFGERDAAERFYNTIKRPNFTITFAPYDPPNPSRYAELANDSSSAVREMYAEWLAAQPDPPQPEKLTDLPDWCVAEGVDGRHYFHVGGVTWMLGKTNPFEMRPLTDEGGDISIARVLGTPVFNQGGGE